MCRDDRQTDALHDAVADGRAKFCTVGLYISSPKVESDGRILFFFVLRQHEPNMTNRRPRSAIAQTHNSASRHSSIPCILVTVVDGKGRLKRVA